MKKTRSYADTTAIRRRGRGSHVDAEELVKYLMDRDGKTDIPNEQIARELGWEQRVGLTRTTHMERFHIARNHIKDGRLANGQHCTGYTVHYRTSNQSSELYLIDPNGSLLELKQAAQEDLMGDLQQQVSQRTVNGRRIAAAEAMGQWCLKSTPPDMIGYQLMTEYTVEIDKFGAVSDTLIARIMAWVTSP